MPGIGVLYLRRTTRQPAKLKAAVALVLALARREAKFSPVLAHMLANGIPLDIDNYLRLDWWDEPETDRYTRIAGRDSRVPSASPRRGYGAKTDRRSHRGITRLTLPN